MKSSLPASPLLVCRHFKNPGSQKSKLPAPDPRNVGSNARRSAYSRAYYAIYNASKATRYMVYGQISLAGDDHSEASKLPDDFPQAANWTPLIATLYEHRLRADYDNWADTNAENTVTPNDCIASAHQFLLECESYIYTKFKVQL